jgi:hypothetical protein
MVRGFESLLFRKKSLETNGFQGSIIFYSCNIYNNADKNSIKNKYFFTRNIITNMRIKLELAAF